MCVVHMYVCTFNCGHTLCCITSYVAMYTHNVRMYELINDYVSDFKSFLITFYVCMYMYLTLIHGDTSCVHM